MTSIGSAGPRNRFVLGLLGAAFECLVQLLESGKGVAVKRRGGKGNQDAAELLLLAEADPTVAERFDGEAVVAVEQAGKQQVAEPAQPPTGVGLQHGGPQGGAAAAGRLHAEVQAVAGRAVPLARVMNGFQSG